MLVTLGKAGVFCLCLASFALLIVSEVERFLRGRTNISTSTRRNKNPFMPSITVCHAQPYRSVKDVAKMMQLEVYDSNTFSKNETYQLQTKHTVEEIRTVFSGKCFVFTKKEEIASGQIGFFQLKKSKNMKVYFHRKYRINEIIYDRHFTALSKF